MGASQHSVVIGVGELLWDCFADARRPGGAPANVAFHARQLGLRGVVCTRVGADAPGRELIQYLVDRGLETRCVQRDDEHATGLVTVDTSRPDHPIYTIHEDAAWDYAEFDASWAGAFAEAAAVCFGTLAQRSAGSREAISRGLDATAEALRVYDVNLRPPWYTREVIEASLHRATVVKLNAAELETLADLLGLTGHGTADLGRALLDRYAGQLVCITRGKAGCLLVSPDELVDVPGRAVEMVDAVGAGDAFTAGLTCGLLGGWPLEAVGRFANAVGALVASRPGAMPDLRAEFADLRSGFPD